MWRPPWTASATPTITSATTPRPPHVTAAPYTCTPSSGPATSGPRPWPTPATPTTWRGTCPPPATPGRKPCACLTGCIISMPTSYAPNSTPSLAAYQQGRRPLRSRQQCRDAGSQPLPAGRDGPRSAALWPPRGDNAGVTMGWPAGAGVMDVDQVGDGDGCGSGSYRAARLAALVRDHRRAAGLTQGQLASLSGVSLAAIRDLEQGRTHRPRTGSLARLADALGLDAIQAGELAVLARESGRPVAGARGGARPDGAADGLRLQVLGPLVARRDGVRLPL